MGETAVAAVIAWSNTMPCLIYALAFWSGSKYIAQGEMTVAEVTTTAVTVIIGEFAIARIAPSVQSLASGLAVVGTVMQSLARESPVDPLSTDGLTPEVTIGEVVFDNVGLVYPSRDHVRVLDNLTFTCPAMKTTAIVGASGCGKSSIVGLLERFYEPTKGQVQLDGRDVQSLNVRWLRRQISVVSQDPILFSGSIAENIQNGCPDDFEQCSEGEARERIIQAARAAQAHDFITQLPDGYDTQVGERGSRLSGGQRQRVAIARALVKKPRILLLDEATSALDSKSEVAIQAALATATKNCTTVVIAHRLSTVRNADNIVVIVDGGVREQGTHDELVAAKGAYARLIENLHRDDKGAGMDVIKAHSAKASGSTPYGEDSNEEEIEALVEPLRVTTSPASDPLKQSTIQTLSFIARMSRQNRNAILLGLACAILTGLGIPAQSVFFAELLTCLSRPPSEYTEMQRGVDLWAGLYVAISVVTFALWLCLGLVLSYATLQMTRRVRIACFKSILGQDIAFFDDMRNDATGLANLLSKSANELAGIGGSVIAGILTFVATIVAGIILSLAIGWKLALVCTATIPVVVACGWLRLQMLFSLDSKIRQSGKSSAAYAGKLVRAVQTVAALRLEQHALIIYRKSLRRQASDSWGSMILASSMYAASQSAVYLCAALVFWYGGGLIAAKEYSIFQFYICFVTLIIGSQIAGSIFTYAPDASKARQAAGELQRILHATPTINERLWTGSTSMDGNQDLTDVDQAEKLQASKQLQGTYQIDFRDVSFTYPSRPGSRALDGLNLSIKPGETVALVGRSGSGKSTCVSLLERFYDVGSGQILVNGRDIRGIDVEEYRQSVALVSQETMLLSGTIRENLAIARGGQQVSDDEILDACRNANILEYVESLSDGLSTNVGTGGSMLSGGQKQRIAIARAFLRKPQLLLLDEATSALDTESETIVQAAMDAIRQGRTTVIVAHRLRTIVDADVICVLQDGKLKEMGTHRQLMESRGAYYSMAKLQGLD